MDSKMYLKNNRYVNAGIDNRNEGRNIATGRVIYLSLHP